MEFKEIKTKIAAAYSTAKKKTNDAAVWVIENPEKAVGVLTVVSMVAGASAKVYKKVSRSISEHEAARHMYCGTVNRSVRLRHPLSDREIKQLGTLMQSGMTRYEALSVMGVIK